MFLELLRHNGPVGECLFSSTGFLKTHFQSTVTVIKTETGKKELKIKIVHWGEHRKVLACACIMVAPGGCVVGVPGAIGCILDSSWWMRCWCARCHRLHPFTLKSIVRLLPLLPLFTDAETEVQELAQSWVELINNRPGIKPGLQRKWCFGIQANAIGKQILLILLGHVAILGTH